MNRYMAAPGIMLLVLLHLQLIFHPLQQPFFLFALLLFLSALWLMICRRIGMKLTLTLLLILLAAAIIMFPITLDALRVFYNMLLETYRQHSTLYFMSLDTRSVQGSEQLLLAGTMLAFFLIGTLLFHWFIALKRHSRLAFLLLISFLLPCMLHSVPQPPTALILLLVLAALLMDSAQGLTMIMQRRLRMLFMLFACIVPIAVCVLLIPPAQISGSGQGVRDQLLTSLTNLIERITGSGSNDEIDLTQAQDRLYIGSSRGRVLATLEDTYYLKDMSAGVYEDNTWKAIAEEDYVDELGERYDYSRIDTLMSWMNIMGSSSEGMSVTLPSLTIQDMRGDDAHQPAVAKNHDLIAEGEHHVEILPDKQNARSAFLLAVEDIVNEVRRIDVEPAHGICRDQHVRLGQDLSSQQHLLHVPARKFPHGRFRGRGNYVQFLYDAFRVRAGDFAVHENTVAVQPCARFIDGAAHFRFERPVAFRAEGYKGQRGKYRRIHNDPLCLDPRVFQRLYQKPSESIVSYFSQKSCFSPVSV